MRLFILFTGLISLITSAAEAASIKPENAVWEVLTNRSFIQSLAFSQDEMTVWVGTNGGLEQREAQTGQLKKAFTNLDGLPSNRVQSLLSDTAGNLWIGTDNGLGLRDANGQLTTLNTSNSSLPDDAVNALLADGNGGLWIGTRVGGLAHRDADNTWKVYTMTNSKLPTNQISTLSADGAGGIWIGTPQGLIHRTIFGSWGAEATPWNPDSTLSWLPNKEVTALASDNHGGLWVGTHSGLAHRDAYGEWTIFYPDDLGLTLISVATLQPDDEGGIWIGTGDSFSGIGQGLLHLSARGQWRIFNTDSGLPSHIVTSLLTDKQKRLWAGTFKGLVQRSAAGTWTTFKTSTELPTNGINALLLDSNNGLWIGTGNLRGKEEGGLAYRSATGEWMTFDTTNGLPDKRITTLAADDKGGIWVGTLNGLAHRDAAGQWTTYDNTTSQLPTNEISTLVSDGHGGVWLGSEWLNTTGVAHLTAAGEFEISSYENGQLPSNQVKTLFQDSSGNVWAGTYYGLLYRGTDGQWITLDEETDATLALLRTSNPNTLFVDDLGAVWVGTQGGGLLQRGTDGKWQIFNTENSPLPSNEVKSLLADGEGGLWIGTASERRFQGNGNGGLAHRDADGHWFVLQDSNSGLPTNFIAALATDGSGGLWVGTWGLAHLTFGQKQNLLAQKVSGADASVSTSEVATLLNGERAAILIHPKGQGSGYNQEQSVDFMASYAYHTLYARGYDNDEIYFLSYKPDLDFNGDEQADYNVIDAPVTLYDFRNQGAEPRNLTVADVQAAFEWVKAKGQLQQPLIVVFIDHGLAGELLLDPEGKELLTGDVFKQLLDDYQAVTTNKVVVVLEACHSGTLVPKLAAPNRVIISSTDDNLAYYDDLGRTSFLKAYFDKLRQGENLSYALTAVTETIATYRSPLNRQRPQLEDSSNGKVAREICLNGCFGSLPGVLTLTPQTSTDTVSAGQTVDLTVDTNVSGTSVTSIWASVTTPEVANQRNEQGFSRLPTPVTYLRQGERNRWEGRFDQFSTQGEYVFSFKAKDADGFVTEAKPLTVAVAEGQPLIRAQFNAATGLLHLPAVTIPNAAGATDVYAADLQLQSADPIVFNLVIESLQPVTDTTTLSQAHFDPEDGTVHIPFVEVPNTAAGMDVYNVTLQLEPQVAPLRFTIIKMDLM